MKFLRPLALALGCSTGAQAATLSWSYAPKMILRSGASVIENTVKDRTLVSFGGIGVMGVWYFLPWLAATFGYRADLDLAKSVVLLQGFDVEGRFYFFGTGTQVYRGEGTEYSRSSRSTWSGYISSSFGKRDYTLPIAGAAPLTGTNQSVDLGIGFDYALNRPFELNAEMDYTLLRFSSDPSNVQLRTLTMSLGIGYVF